MKWKHLYPLTFLFFLYLHPSFAQIESKQTFSAYFEAGEKALSQSKFKAAATYFQKAISAFEPHRDSLLLGKCYLYMGKIFGKLDKPDQAEGYATTAKNIFLQYHNDSLLIKAYIILGNTYSLKRKDDEARELYLHALALADSLGLDATRKSLLNNLGVLSYNGKKYTQAISYYRKALALSEKSNDMANTSMLLINIGISYAGLGQRNKAIQFIQKGIEQAEQIKDLYSLYIGYEELAEIYANAGDYQSAFRYIKQSTAAKDSLAAAEINLKIAELEAEYNARQKEQEIFRLKEERHLSQLANLAKQNKINKLNTALISSAIGLFMLFLFFLYAFMQYKKKLLLAVELKQKNQKLSEMLQRNKKLESALRRDLDYQKQMALRKQMNPHFIFNSLNSVQNYILTNNKIEANLHLGQLSTLIRRVLENSEKEFISLQEELFVCEAYIKLEQKRFSKKFSYQIYIDKGIKLEDIKVPPLILQPFIENAIWHGLMHKTGDARLEISITEGQSEIVVSIKDNGVGRVAKTSSMSRNNKKSMGIELTANLLNLTNKLHEENFSLEIIDLFAENNEPSGTQVLVKIKKRRT